MNIKNKRITQNIYIIFRALNKLMYKHISWSQRGLSIF